MKRFIAWVFVKRVHVGHLRVARDGVPKVAVVVRPRLWTRPVIWGVGRLMKLFDTLFRH